MTFHMLGIIVPIDELIFFRGVGRPPTRFTIVVIISTQLQQNLG